MRGTKNVTLGIIAVFMMIYIVLIGMNIYITHTNKQQLENAIPRTVEHALKSGMESGDEAAVKSILTEELEKAVPNADSIQIDIPALDLKKGILSVEVSVGYSLLTGEEKSITAKKTMIMERQIAKEDRVTVTFLVDEEVYKEYQLVQGQSCPLPVLPSKYFAGWVEYGQASNKIIQSIGKVWSDKVYIAVAK